jgi:hypothetical protein
VSSLIPKDGEVNLITCDKRGMKTFAYSPMANEIALVNTMKFPNEVSQV